MSAVGYSNYKVLQIAKPERGIVVDTRGRVVGFDYYESVYSPMVTASMTEIDAGGTVTNTNGIRGTLKDALPIEGNEDVFFNISTAYKDLNFTKTPMKTLGSPLNIDANTKQVTNITMVSKYAFDNANIALSKVYQEAPISDIVEKILDELKIPKDKIISPGVIDSTTNFVEHPEVVKNRILTFSKVIDAEQLLAGTDCGFSTFAGFGNVDENIVYKKLESLVSGAELASKVI